MVDASFRTLYISFLHQKSKIRRRYHPIHVKRSYFVHEEQVSPFQTFPSSMGSDEVPKSQHVYLIAQWLKSKTFAYRPNSYHMQSDQELKHGRQLNYQNDRKILATSMHTVQQECPFPKHPNQNRTENGNFYVSKCIVFIFDFESLFSLHVRLCRWRSSILAL